MARKKIIAAVIFFTLIIIVYFPGFSRLQKLKEENDRLENKILELKKDNSNLETEMHKLKTDPTYLEGVARNKLKKAKKGEIIYKID